MTIEEVIREETGYTGELEPSTRIDLIVSDSLEFVSLIAAIENALGFKIPDKKYVEVQTLADLYSFIDNYIST